MNKSIFRRCIIVLFIFLMHLFPLYSRTNSDLKPDSPSFDNGIIINQLAQESTVVIPEGTFYFSTPLVFEKCRIITINGNLVYNGPKGKTAVTVKGNNIIFDLNGSVSYGKTPLFDGETDSNTTIGINFINTNNSRVYINEIKFFNECIRISGVGAGSSYNKFSFGIVRNCLVGLRIYQEDYNGKRGWVNENTFIGGRFTNFSDWKFKDQSIAIKISGASHKKDSYNSSNSNLFLKQCFEGFNTIVIAKNIRNCDFLYARLEGSKVFVKFIGECRQCRVSYDFGSECKLYDDTESKWIPIRVDECIFNHVSSIDFSTPRIANNASGDVVAQIDGCGFLGKKANSTDLQLFSHFTNNNQSVVFEDPPAINMFSAGGNIYKITSPSQTSIQIYYLTDSENRQIKKGALYTSPITLLKSSFTTTSISGRVAYTTQIKEGVLYFKIPDSIGTIQISFGNSPEKVSVSCTSTVSRLEYPKIRNAGDSKSRPEYAYWGQYYYDTTLDKPVWWNGHVWQLY